MEQDLVSSAQASTSSSPSLEDLMKLLTGKTDSQRLAGLLLVTKFCDKDDHQTILNVYHAVGSTFLRRLLRTGMGKGTGGGGGDNTNRDVYLRLSVTVLASFARVPEIAATQEMLASIPDFVEVMSAGFDPSLIEECWEFLCLVSTGHEEGLTTLFESGGVSVLASQMASLQDGSHAMLLAIRLIQLIISKEPAKLFMDHPSELSKMVAAISKQFAVLHDAVKFEALHLLSAILSSDCSGALHETLKSMVSDDWSVNVRVGVIDVLQNRMVPAEKLHALVLAESVVSIVGEEWLIGSVIIPNTQSSVPADRCILLVLESSRVEIAVILNELAYLKYEACKSFGDEAFAVKLRDLGVTFALVERVIKLISKLESESTSVISEITTIKIIAGLNETVGIALDYLQDAKEHGQRKGDDLLASVRLVGSYLAESPDACKEKVEELLSYMLSVEGADEPRPFHSISFLLPMLCQITMRNAGCKLFASTGAFEAVVECLISMIDSSSSKDGDGSTIFLACDTILNVLLKREQIRFSLDTPSSVRLLLALLRWTEDEVESSVVMMASSICTLILDSTSEEDLMRHQDFNADDLILLSQLIKRSLVTFGQDMVSDNTGSDADLHQIVTSGYYSWVDRFPHIREMVGV